MNQIHNDFDIATFYGGFEQPLKLGFCACKYGFGEQVVWLGNLGYEELDERRGTSAKCVSTRGEEHKRRGRDAGGNSESVNEKKGPRRFLWKTDWVFNFKGDFDKKTSLKRCFKDGFTRIVFEKLWLFTNMPSCFLRQWSFRTVLDTM